MYNISFFSPLLFFDVPHIKDAAAVAAAGSISLCRPGNPLRSPLSAVNEIHRLEKRMGSHARSRSPNDFSLLKI
jgi:hypothetical protein